MFVTVIKSPVLRQYAAVVIVNLSVMAVGLGVAWSSPVLVKLQDKNDPVLKEPISEVEGAWVVSVPFLCGLITNFLAIYLIGKLGPKRTFILAAIPRILSYVLLTFAKEVWMILLGRLLGGLSDGLTFTVVPVYASEVASNAVRGGLGTMLQMFASLGIVTMLCMGPFLDYYTLNAIVLTIAVLTAIPLIFLPDSPYYLYRKGKTQEALDVLTYFRGSETIAQDEIKAFEASQQENITIAELLKSKTVLKALGMVIIMGAGSQLTGYNAVAFYLQTILESTGTSMSSEIASVILGCIQLIAAIMTTIIIDKFGRKPILGCSLVGVAVGMVGLGTFFKLKEAGHEIVGAMNFLPLVSLILVVYCFSGGPGALLWPLMSELFEGRSRAIGVSASLIFNVSFLFLTTRFFPALSHALGPSTTYWLFSVNTALLCLFILFCVPETKGKSFVEIQEALGGHKGLKDGDKI